MAPYFQSLDSILDDEQLFEESGAKFEEAPMAQRQCDRNARRLQAIRYLLTQEENE